MSTREVCTLQLGGFEIGAHGAHHINLSRVCQKEALLEMLESKHDLESLLGVPVNFMAYPYGEFPPGYDNLCRQAGYLGACAISSSASYVLSAPYALRRILIYSKDRGWRYKLKLNHLYLRLLARRDRRNLREKSGY